MLEIGTGSGYHAAVLDEMGAEVPVGPPPWQRLMSIARSESGFDEESLESVAFVPMRRRDHFGG